MVLRSRINDCIGGYLTVGYRSDISRVHRLGPVGYESDISSMHRLGLVGYKSDISSMVEAEFMTIGIGAIGAIGRNQLVIYRSDSG